MSKKALTILFVANFDSDVGYAWRLIESFWLTLNNHARENYKGKCYLFYPTISHVPKHIAESDIDVFEYAFASQGLTSFLRDLLNIVKFKINVIYLTDKKTASLRYLIYRLFGVSVIIVHDHKPGKRSELNSSKRLIKKIIASIPGMQCDAAFAVSPYIAKRLSQVDLVPQKKIFEVTNGIELKEKIFSPKTSSDTVKIITVSRMTAYKGIEFGLRMIEGAVKTASKQIEYIVIGDGPDLDYFKNIAESLGIKSHVKFLGKRDDVKEILSGCDIALHPSYGEALSLAILEYMDSFIPVICSDNESVSSILENGEDALLYREHNLADAVEKLLHILNDQELRIRLARNAYTKLTDSHNIKRTHKLLRDAFDKALNT